jgi:hypothetical protein
MDDRRFDHLTRILATTAPRRVFSGALSGGLLVTLRDWSGEDAAAKKRRKKKKKKPPVCAPKCAGKVCGDSDTCGGVCTACPSGKECKNNTCVPDSCGGSCRGNHVCKNGACVCEVGLKECDAFNCGECCPDPFHGNGDADCEGHPNGPFCTTEIGKPVLHCTCDSVQKRCSDGRCVPVHGCCSDANCLVDFGPGSFCNANGGCECPEGTHQCGGGLGCRDIFTDRFACGGNCMACGAGWLCENANCCIGLANDCGLNPTSCCGGLQCNNVGTIFEPEFVCGDPP